MPFSRVILGTIGQQCADYMGHLIWKSKLCKPGKMFCENKLKYFSFLAYQRSLQILYEMLDMLIETLAAFTVR